MGDVQRIFYYHVPSAWTAFLLFFINLVASIHYLVRRSPSGSRRKLDGDRDRGSDLYRRLRGSVAARGRESSVATTGIAIAAIYFLIPRCFPGSDAMSSRW